MEKVCPTTEGCEEQVGSRRSEIKVEKHDEKLNDSRGGRRQLLFLSCAVEETPLDGA